MWLLIYNVSSECKMIAQATGTYYASIGSGKRYQATWIVQGINVILCDSEKRYFGELYASTSTNRFRIKNLAA